MQKWKITYNFSLFKQLFYSCLCLLHTYAHISYTIRTCTIHSVIILYRQKYFLSVRDIDIFTYKFLYLCPKICFTSDFTNLLCYKNAWYSTYSYSCIYIRKFVSINYPLNHIYLINTVLISILTTWKYKYIHIWFLQFHYLIL